MTISIAAVLIECQVKWLEWWFIIARKLLGEWSLLELNQERVRNPWCSATIYIRSTENVWRHWHMISCLIILKAVAMCFIKGSKVALVIK